MRRLANTPIALLVALVTSALVAEAASDPRFFGHYCGEILIKHPVDFCFHGDGILVLPVTIDGHVEYVERVPGRGLVLGEVIADFEPATGPEVRSICEDHFNQLLSGDIELPVVFAGAVVATGEFLGSGRMPGYEPIDGVTASLSDDGDTLAVQVLGFTVVLSKAACGNQPPTATIDSPADGAVLGAEVALLGTASDPEDDHFPAERLTWTSDLDGRLADGLVSLNFLSPGLHHITFTVTDSGGRIDEASVAIHVQDNRPTVIIHRPFDREHFVVGLPIPFRGEANDFEDGLLGSTSLSWFSRLASSPEGVPETVVGFGSELYRLLPVGTHIITLKAADRGRGEGSAFVIVYVAEPRPGENNPPTVMILGPDSSPRSTYSVAAINNLPCGEGLGGTLVTLHARAWDLEDCHLTAHYWTWDPPPADCDLTTRGSLVWTDHYWNGPEEKIVELGFGDRVRFCGSQLEHLGSDTLHKIMVTATDSGDPTGERLSGSDFIEFMLVGGGII